MRNHLKDEDKVAIVIPVYNGERYLRQLLNSIQRQTYQAWIAVIVDDGSTDKTSIIVDEFVKKDKRFHCIHQKNKGAVEARKAGVLCEETQNCKYTVVCDADDILVPQMLYKLWQTIKNSNADWGCANMHSVWHNIKIPNQYKRPCFQISKPEFYDRERMLKELFMSFYGVSNFPVSLCSKIYKTELLSKAIDFDPIVKFAGEDFCVVIRVMAMANNVVVMPDELYLYRIGGGTSSFMPYMLDDFLNLYALKMSFIGLCEDKNMAIKYANYELLNITKSYFINCFICGKFSDKKMKEVIDNTCKINQIRQAAYDIQRQDNDAGAYSNLIINEDIDRIFIIIQETVKKQAIRNLIKKMLK